MYRVLDSEATHARTEPRPHRYRDRLLRLLEGCGEPVSAQALHAMLRVESARAGLSTVYRELHLLAQRGRIREMRTDTETLYHTLKGDLLMCDRCGRVQAVDRGIPIGLSEQIERFYRSGPITVHGHCKRCGAARR